MNPHAANPHAIPGLGLIGPGVRFKPLIALVATVLGAAAVGVILTIQNDRFAFTTRDAASLASMGRLPLPAELDVGAALSLAKLANVVQIDEVTVVGRLSRLPRRAAPAVASEPAEIHHKVIPAVCADGEYRVIDETRGVTLNCPGGSLEE